MFSTVSSWFSGNEDSKTSEKDIEKKDTDPSTSNQNETPAKPEQATTKSNGDKSETKSDKSDKTDQKTEGETKQESSEEDVDFDIDIDKAKQKMMEVSDKAVHTAKEWGSYFYNFGKVAGQTVADTAKQLKNSMEESSLLGDFSKEQEKFLADKKEKERKAEAAVPPWVGYNEEETMKTQILALSADKRNFLRNPPSGVQFQFDYTTVHPVAMATMYEDPNLEKMRYDLVPKQVNEEIFWRNYFYRVSLIKQSTQLTSLAQQSGNTGERSSGSSRRSSTGSESKEISSSEPAAKKKDQDDNIPVGSPPHDNEFVSDTFDPSQIDEEDLQKEIELLRVSDNKDLTSEEGNKETQWEKDLQKELQDFELVNTDIGAIDDDDDLESEILKQIEDEANGM